ncbi:hypothetical protein TNIN_394191 [Trichonephila inaurata madagascariensis]|uniref:Uncharacterized protein n=1 Tax=Trichonephila inaurata madagascariensis TaxID=2747483 RepID=A0A8X7CEC4_9ARAC|nr:hypothetical protein TNIN_394191 [Trichonephila inaurata madagascariensis]
MEDESSDPRGGGSTSGPRERQGQRRRELVKHVTAFASVAMMSEAGLETREQRKTAQIPSPFEHCSAKCGSPDRIAPAEEKGNQLFELIPSRKLVARSGPGQTVINQKTFTIDIFLARDENFFFSRSMR